MKLSNTVRITENESRRHEIFGGSELLMDLQMNYFSKLFLFVKLGVMMSNMFYI